MPPLEEARELVGGMFVERRAADHDRGLEEDPRARPQLRDPRRPPALPARAREGRRRRRSQIREALAPLYERAREGDRLEEGRDHEAHQPRSSTALLDAAATLDGRRRGARRAASTSKKLEKARELGNGLLARGARRPSPAPTTTELRELANDLCLRTDGKIQKEDLDAIVQWALKVREMYQDIESRREDAREAAVELGPPARGDVAAVPRARVEADRQRRADLPRAQGPLRLAVRLRRLLPGRHGRGGDPRPAQGPRPRRRGRARCARRSRPRRARSRQRAIKRLKVVERVHQVGEQARVDGPRGDPGDPAGAPPDGAARRRPLRHLAT